MDLFEARDHLYARPADERFWNLDDMYDATVEESERAEEVVLRLGEMHVIPQGAGVALRGPTGWLARLNYWSFGQVCGIIGAPAGYLRRLSPKLVAENLTFGLKLIHNKEASSNGLLHHGDDGDVIRSVTSDKYARIWNHQVVKKLRDDAGKRGWQLPPERPAFPGEPGAHPATPADVQLRGDLARPKIKVGQLVVPSGLYASEHDMFAFMVNDRYRIDDGTDTGLSRGFFITNSEVGASAFKLTKFLFRYVCGNHIVWDVSDVEELRIVHRGSANDRWEMTVHSTLRKYATGSATSDEQRIRRAKGSELGASKEQVIDKLFALRILPRVVLEAAFVEGEREADLRTDVSPRSVWGIVQGITAMSQREVFADRRVELDRAAGRILAIAN